eukprot:792540-Pyramimonas_sp.AAC.1
MPDADTSADADTEADVHTLQVREAGVVPNVAVYGALLHAYAAEGRWEAALTTLAEIRKEGERPNTVAYTSAIRCDIGG